MKPAGQFVLDNEAVQVLMDPNHVKHRRMQAIVQAASLRKAQFVVPTSVRVEAGWDRTQPAAAIINRQRIADHRLDETAANHAAAIVTALGVSVADAHIGAMLETSPSGPFVVATSDPDDISAISAHMGRPITIIRI